MASRVALLVLLLILFDVVLVSGTSITLHGIDGEENVFSCQLTSPGDKKRFRPGQREDALCENILPKLTNPESNFDGFDFSMELETAEDVEDFKKKYRALGSKIVKLIWTSFDDKAYTFREFNEVFDLMPNLKFLKMSFWNDKQPITGWTSSEVLNLKKLETFELDNVASIFMEFFTEALQKNLLRNFISDGKYSDTIFSNFFAQQSAIKSLDLQGNFHEVEVFKKLQLEKFANGFLDDDHLSRKKKFIKSLAKQQPYLTELNLLSVDYIYGHVDDEVLAEICKLEKLTTLRFNIDGISPTAIQKISQIKKLKSLEVKTNHKTSIETWKKLSELRMPKIEKMILRLWGFELPQQIYKNFAQNLENLKSLTITLGNRQKLNFFMENFNNLESLDVKFGESNRRMTFDEAYDDDGQQNLKTKSLNLIFLGEEISNTAKFIKMLKAFPNLEKLAIDSRFPFTAEFFSILYENIRKIDDLNLGYFVIPCNEDFPQPTTQILKNFEAKLNKCKFSFLNSINHAMQGDVCLMRKNGKLEEENVNSYADNVYKLLIEALKQTFEIESDGYSNIRTVSILTLNGGKHKKY